ncbi:hypothetical protein DYB37_002463 [Aphanomyces astaci]|uniref:FYVE-type domain-containing protein n=1 Tax=Aphanomyces astaci TaxID=112090 RepID=A0A397AJV4_APHAT|nr:hypothetical protein DYB36_004205 [Aphanomyces astaci]RHY11739.1 hypothetical protein DYB25_007828 [Aphanomyces astaci]RHY66715.1 hypothetical protein DYB34_008014 [Aphanomyces astaci]RHY70815.1 hypothetical protein DYB30_007358 [Aphanomyces astaci]RHY76171.1 hypothetical protein DYB38_007906 [Aphanomyces astaci]
MPKLNEAIRLAEASNWQGLLTLVTASPLCARDCDDYGMLPIHWAATENTAPLTLLECLVEAYPEGVQIPNKAQLLPLHIAIRAGAGVPTLQLLLTAYPDSIWVETPSGTPPTLLGVQSNLSSDCLDLLRATERLVPFDVQWTNQKAVKSPSSVTSPTHQNSNRPHSWHTISRQASTPAIMTPPPHTAPLELSYERSDGNSSEDNNSPAQATSLPPAWMLIEECFICRVPFNMFKHRHHCRNCGMSICSAHSSETKMTMPGFTNPQRACLSCAAVLRRPPPPPHTTLPDNQQRRRTSKLFTSMVSPKTRDKQGGRDLRLRVAELTKQVDQLAQTNMGMQQQLLEQEELKAETMLLITQVMTRVSVLELQNEKYRQSDDFDM